MPPGLRLITLLAFVSLAVPRAVFANTLDYKFIGSTDGIDFSFTYDSPVLIVADASGNQPAPDTLIDFGTADMFTAATHATTTHGSVTITDVANNLMLPEPSSVLLLGTGLLGLAGVTRRRLFS